MRRPHPPLGLDAVGPDTVAAVRASKRPRVEVLAGLESRSTSLWNQNSPKNGSQNGRERYTPAGTGFAGNEEDGNEKAEEKKGGGFCAFRWPAGDIDGGDMTDNACGYSSGVGRAALLNGEREADRGTNSAPALGGGGSAAHPTEMGVVVVGGGQESGLIKGGHGWRVLTRGMGEAGGGAVIASGFGAGGFPQHQWHQDQGGSSDDMLILYGSPS